MAEYEEKMLALRQELPQGGTKRSKATIGQPELTETQLTQREEAFEQQRLEDIAEAERAGVLGPLRAVEKQESAATEAPKAPEEVQLAPERMASFRSF